MTKALRKTLNSNVFLFGMKMISQLFHEHLCWILIGSEVSFPFLVTTSTLAFQLLQSLAMPLQNLTGDLCNNILPFNQPWPTESYAFLTSIYAILRSRPPLWQPKVTVRSINRMPTVPLHPARAPLPAPSITLHLSRCRSVGQMGKTWTICTCK